MEEELLKRWRLILGGDEADGTGVTLNLEEQRIDHSLEAVYDSDRRGGLGSSAPKVSRWLGDIREFFPQTVVQVIQRDAIKRLNLTSLLTEKEMLETVVPDVHLYSGIFGSVLASIPAVSTRMVVFDTAVVDLTDDLQDPVDLLFGVQLGGGTDIARALTYCQGVITRPQDTVMVLVTDLYEGGDSREMRKKFVSLVNSGVQLIALPALNDDGAPSYDKGHAEFLASIGVPTFACTPDKFPDLMAAALSKQDIGMWVSQNVKSE